MHVPRTCLALVALIAAAAVSIPPQQKSPRDLLTRTLVTPLAQAAEINNNSTQGQGKHHCEQIHEAFDRCDYARQYCSPSSAGMVDYIAWYYCDMEAAQPLAFSILVTWTAVLFSTIGIASSDFFCPNLATIANSLGMSQSVAGVTFLAFGNGSPDVFSTFAAFKAHSGSLAIGELLGAAAFITSVVAGSMAIISPFKVSRRSFLRDAGFFMVAVVMTMILLADGRLRLWESVLMIVFYVIYVAYVLIGTYFNTKTNKRKIIDSRIRSRYAATGEETQTSLDDDLDEDTARLLGENQQAITDIDFDDTDDEEHDFHDINSSMSITGRAPNASKNTVRPSLLGALEFRQLVSSLSIDGAINPNAVATMKRRSRANSAAGPAPRNLRPGADRPRSATTVPSTTGMLSPELTFIHRNQDTKRELDANSRDTRSAAKEIQQRPGVSRSSTRSQEELRRDEIASTSLRKHEPIELLSPNLRSVTPPASSAELPSFIIEPPSDERDSLAKVWVHQDSSHGSSTAPTYETMNEIVHDRSPPIDMPRSDIAADPTAPLGTQEHYVPTWWPNQMLPDPGQLRDLLFPTLVDFANQSHTQRLLAILAVPSVFVLTVTLPVVNPPVDQKMAELNEEGADLEAVVAKEDGERITAHRGWNRWLTSLQCILTPLLVSIMIFIGEPLLIPILISLAIGFVLLTFTLLLTSHDQRPKQHSWFCFIGFAISVCWISTIANEVVGTLQAFGTILGLSDAILGLTVFAVGNSLGDFVADVTVARMGFSQMAISGVFGGPMLNILLGIGISGIYINLSKVSKH